MRLQNQLDIYSRFALLYHQLQTMFRTFPIAKLSFRTESLSIGLIGLLKSRTDDQAISLIERLLIKRFQVEFLVHFQSSVFMVEKL